MKLLLVDDNKMLAKAIAKKVESSINCEFDIAYDYAQAKQFLENNTYFAAMLDLCLPDAMHGEVVDFALSKKVPSIILTGLDDEETRKKFMDKDIVDYVLKEGSECVNYIIDILGRLERNASTKIIVAEDSMPMRNLIKSILESYKFQVFPAAHGVEALSYLEQHPDVKLILTDKEMPAMSGEELIKEVRKDYKKEELGIIVLTAYGSDEVGVRMLKSGANDFIHKPFSRENMICRINNSIDLISYAEQLREMADKDFLTKLRNRKSFFEAANLYLEQMPENQTYVIFMIDIDRFKNINDTLGHSAGDAVIKHCANIITNKVKGADLVSRFGGEEFCMLLKNIKIEDAVKIAVKIRHAIKQQIIKFNKNEIPFTVSIGVAIGDKSSNLNKIINNADDALYKAKNNGRDRVELSDANDN